jgi:hypothetical protein
VIENKNLNMEEMAQQEQNIDRRWRNKNRTKRKLRNNKDIKKMVSTTEHTGGGQEHR